MADNFALGNALMTFGQTGGNAINQYFNEQIGAAQHAQEQTLKMLQFKSEQDLKERQLSETGRAHDLEHTDRQATEQANAKYHEGELANTAQRNANEKDYQGNEIAVNRGRLANEEANTASEIGHRGVEEKQGEEKIEIDRQKALNEANAHKGEGAALKAGQEVYEKQIKDLKEQIHQLNPDNASVLPDETKSKVDALNSQLKQLTEAHGHNLADQSRINKLDAPMAGNEIAPKDPGSQGLGAAIDDARAHPKPVAGPSKAAQITQTKPSGTAAKPMPLQPGARTATNPQTGEKLQLVNGQWVPVANG